MAASFARRDGDYTQLTSYLGNLESSGVPADKVRGILVAPGFSQRVLKRGSDRAADYAVAVQQRGL